MQERVVLKERGEQSISAIVVQAKRHLKNDAGRPLEKDSRGDRGNILRVLKRWLK